MSTKLSKLAATSVAAVALATAGTALAAPAGAATAGSGATIASSWIKYGDYSSDAKCRAKGEALRKSGAYLSYYCEYTGFFTLMVLTR
ncbi:MULTISPECIES: hypothetical protein [Thermomonosporaceae]|uniref:hypothetical protein n=1 Tax=Thermomonosporaceae TaxID=2012 RepID=UPI00255A7C07|nr:MULTISPECIES: hypothetical protein [Thermomonosporaceae]MDL4775324.1 hypothetical protein [Actinomadura xylanilytica]